MCASVYFGLVSIWFVLIRSYPIYLVSFGFVSNRWSWLDCTGSNIETKLAKQTSAQTKQTKCVDATKRVRYRDNAKIDRRRRRRRGNYCGKAQAIKLSQTQLVMRGFLPLAFQILFVCLVNVKSGNASLFHGVAWVIGSRLAGCSQLVCKRNPRVQVRRLLRIWAMSRLWWYCCFCCGNGLEETKRADDDDDERFCWDAS